jgi:hypothetical protein
MPQASGSFLAKISSQALVAPKDVPDHEMSLIEVSGPQTSSDPLWDGAMVSFWGAADLNAGNGIQTGYFMNSHANGDIDRGTFSGTISTAASVVTMEGAWKHSGGTGRFSGITGSGAYKGRIASPTQVEVKWEGTYRLGDASMRRLPPLICPNCDDVMTEMQCIGQIPTATSFESCIRRCERCRVGASNTSNRKAVTYIYSDPLQNIPDESHEGAIEALKNAFNVLNRPSKLRRFGFSTSEDAVTRVVFSYLSRSGDMLPALERSGVITGQLLTKAPTILLWGVPIESSVRGDEIIMKLIEACNSFGEEPNRRSEPDVIIDLGEDGLIFIEVKYRSSNDTQSADYPHWHRYTLAPGLAWQVEDLVASGCYELARNWCLLKRLAGERPATLVNLGPANLFRGKEGERLNRFVAALGPDGKSHFKKLRWCHLLGTDYTSDWFVQFCRDRGLVSSFG